VVKLRDAKTTKEKAAAQRALYTVEQHYAQTAQTISRACVAALVEKEKQDRDPNTPKIMVERLDDAFEKVGALATATNRNMIWTGQAQPARSGRGFWATEAYAIMKELKSAMGRHENVGTYMQLRLDELSSENRMIQKDNVETKREVARQFHAQMQWNVATGTTLTELMGAATRQATTNDGFNQTLGTLHTDLATATQSIGTLQTDSVGFKADLATALRELAKMRKSAGAGVDRSADKGDDMDANEAFVGNMDEETAARHMPSSSAAPPARPAPRKNGVRPALHQQDLAPPQRSELMFGAAQHGAAGTSTSLPSVQAGGVVMQVPCPI
jgi:hypothetical protein